MITNKDIRVENGSLIINGDPYPLDGQSPEAIMEIVEDNSDTTPTENSDAPITSGGVFAAVKDISDTIGDITQTGVTGATVAAQLGSLSDRLMVVTGTLPSTADSVVIQYPSGVNKTDWFIIGWNFTLNNNKYSGFGIGGADKRLSIVMSDENISVYNDDTALFSKGISIILAKL